MDSYLIVAAERLELAGLLDRLDQAQPVNWGLRFTATGYGGGCRFFLVAHGPGNQLSAEAAQVACEQERFSRIILTGLCGALREDLVVGQIISGKALVTSAGAERFDLAPPPGKTTSLGGVFLTVNHVVQTASEKKSLRASTGADAVEMEGEGVAGVARNQDLPMSCIRAVSDLAGENFSNDFNAMRGPDGRFLPLRLGLHSLRRPWSRTPELIRLAARARLASRRLGDHFARSF